MIDYRTVANLLSLSRVCDFFFYLFLYHWLYSVGRSQMQTIISKACAELDIQPVPSQRVCYLFRNSSSLWKLSPLIVLVKKSLTSSLLLWSDINGCLFSLSLDAVYTTGEMARRAICDCLQPTSWVPGGFWSSHSARAAHACGRTGHSPWWTMGICSATSVRSSLLNLINATWCMRLILWCNVIESLWILECKF